MNQQRKDELLLQLRKLQEEEEEVKALLQSTEITLREMGHVVENDTDKKKKRNKNTGALKTGISLDGHLTERGINKCREYFHFIDSDGDSRLCFEDFRAMAAYQGNEIGECEILLICIA